MQSTFVKTLSPPRISLLSRRRCLRAVLLGVTGIGLAACGGTTATSVVTTSATTAVATSTAPKSTTSIAAAVTSSSVATSAQPTVAASTAAVGSATVRTEVWGPWGPGPVQQGYDASLQLLNKQQPAVNAAYMAVSPWPTKFVAAAAGGVPPDAIYGGLGQAMLVISWAYKGLLAPLDQYLTTSKVQESDFYAPCWQENIFRGKNYGLVAEVDPNFALVYNKSMFAEVGLDPAMPPTTIADFDAANQKLLKKTGSTIARMGSTPPWSVYGDPNTLLTWFTQFGGGFIDSNGKLAVAGAENTSALDWIAAYARTYDFAAVTAFTKGYGKFGSVSALATGQIGMAPLVSADFTHLVSLTKSGAISSQDFALGYMPTAQAAQKNKGWVGGWAISQPEGAPHPDQSWQLIHWLTATPEGTDAWASINGFLPAYSPSPFLKRVATQFGYDWYLRVLQSAQTTPPNVAGWGDILPADFHNLLFGPVQGTTTSRDTLATFQKVGAAQLAQYP